MTATVKVRVVVIEDDQVVAESKLTYYSGQDYVVQIVTPDGIDATQARKAGINRPLSPEFEAARRIVTEDAAREPSEWSVKAPDTFVVQPRRMV